MDDEIIVDSNIQEAKSQTKMNYDMFVCVCETKDNFYLFISKRQALIIRKIDISVGSVSDLRNLFLKNIPAGKYITKGVKVL